MSETKQVVVPDIGDFSDVDVIEVLVAPGDAVEVDDWLITLESDKASMEIPSPFSGTVQALMVAVGDKVSEGSAILALAVGAEAQVAAADSRTVLGGTGSRSAAPGDARGSCAGGREAHGAGPDSRD